MQDILAEIVQGFDKFHYAPQLGFKALPKQGTVLGGSCTVMIGLMILYFLQAQLQLMTEYKGYYFKSFVTLANLTDVGVVSFDDMGTLPFFGVHYKGHQLHIKSEKHCSETEGDCFKFTQKFLEIKWKHAIQTEKTWDEKKYDPRICGPDDITKELFERGFLYLCPPKGVMFFQNHFDLYPAQFMGFEVKPNGDDESQKNVNMFQMSRSHINSNSDLNIVSGNPIIKSVKLLGRIQLEHGSQSHTDSFLKLHKLSDTTSWMFGAKDINYEYYQISQYNKERIKNYNDDTVVLSEWMTLDQEQQEITRKVNDLSDVFGKVGGIQHLLVLVFGFFFKPYTLFTYRAEAINTFFTIKTEDKSLIKEKKSHGGGNKLNLSFVDKVRVILGICPKIQLQRLLKKDYKGHRRILKELDMVRIVNDIKYLKEYTKHLDPTAHIVLQKDPREIDLDRDSEDETPALVQLKKSLMMLTQKKIDEQVQQSPSAQDASSDASQYEDMESQIPEIKATKTQILQNQQDETQIELVQPKRITQVNDLHNAQIQSRFPSVPIQLFDSNRYSIKEGAFKSPPFNSTAKSSMKSPKKTNQVENNQIIQRNNLFQEQYRAQQESKIKSGVFKKNLDPGQ